MAADVPLLLIHGVGHHRPGTLRSAVTGALADVGLSEVVPYEFEWDGIFRQARRPTRVLEHDDLTSLGRAFWVASWIGIDDGSAARGAARAHRLGWSSVSALVVLWMLAVTWLALAYGADRIGTDVPPIRVGLPWRAYVFPPLPPELLAQTLPVARAALVAVSQGILGLASILTLVAWLARSIPLASALRAGVFQLAWLPTYALGVLPPFLVGLAVTIFGVGFVSTAAQLKFTIRVPDGTAWNTGPGWRELGAGVAAAVTVATLAAALGWILWRAFKPVIDVVRYIGDQQLREHVHATLATTLAALGPRPHIVVAAHSLGTVIAVDSLLTAPAAWAPFDAIDLVTAGSPLHRLLARFFPSAYPPVADLAECLVRGYPALRWTNVYRPTDYVGGALPAPRIVNRCLRRSPWRMHSNYWSDAHAIAVLRSQLERPLAAVGTRTCLAEVPVGLRVDRRLRAPDVARRSVTGLLVPIAMTGCVAIVWTQFHWTPRAEQLNLAEWHRRTAAEGIRVTVNAYPGTASDDAADPANQHDRDVVAFYYRAEGRVYGAESTVGGLPYAAPRYPHIDWARLTRDLAASGRGHVPIEVVYASTAPRIFVVPGYDAHPSYYGPGRVFFYTLRTAVLLGFWAIWCAGLRTLLSGVAPPSSLRR